MRVVHINSYDGSGGAARAADRLHCALIQEGVHSELVVNLRKEKGLAALRTRHRYIKTFSRGPFAYLRSMFLKAAEMLAVKLLVKPLRVPFSLPFFGKSIHRRRVLRQADIVHLHWVSQGFLSPRSIRQLRRLQVPLVWTMHDSNAFTGGCHVRYGCEHFLQHCGNCPFLKRSGPDDLSNYFWKKKKAAYEDLPLSIVAPSHWMARSVDQSGLLKDKALHVIPNTIDIRLFKPRNRAECREKLGWPADAFIILAGYMPSKVDLHKGGEHLLQSLRLLAAEADPARIRLAVFGASKFNADLPIEHISLGSIRDDERLALCYAAADVFLNTSLEDNLPNTIMESLSCGTPVVSFRTGGIPDMVIHEENGYLAERGSSEEAARGLRWVMAHPSREQLGENARRHILQQFAPEVVARRHIALYHELLKNGNGREG